MVRMTHDAHRDSTSPNPVMNSGFGILRMGLGILWLCDALLQTQPGMFHKAFYGNLPSTLMPSLLQQIEESTVSWAVPALKLTQFLYGQAPILINLLVVAVQLSLAAGLLLPMGRHFVRAAAVASIFWGLSVWVFGEGMGGLFSRGNMTFYNGFPGSALFYALAGLFLLLPASSWRSGQAARRIAYTLATVLALCALLQLLPANQQWQTGTILDLFANSGFQSQPGVMSNPVMAFSLWAAAHARLANLLLLFLLVGAAVTLLFWQRAPRWLRVCLYVWLFFSWWFGMDFGYIFSGLSTDPNTAPIFALLAASSINQLRTRTSDRERPHEKGANSR